MAKKKIIKKRRPQEIRNTYCKFTRLGIKEVDYKDTHLLKEFITETGKIMPARITGN